MTKTREILAFMAIAVLGTALVIAGLFLPGIPSNVAHKSDVQAAIKAAAGAGAVKQAESEIQSEATQAGVVIVKQSVDRVSVKDGKTVVYLSVVTDGGTLHLAITLSKSAYQVTNVQRVS